MLENVMLVADATAPSIDQVQKTISEGKTVVEAFKAFWGDAYPILLWLLSAAGTAAHLAANFGWAQGIPGLNLLAGNYKRATNAPSK